MGIGATIQAPAHPNFETAVWVRNQTSAWQLNIRAYGLGDYR